MQTPMRRVAPRGERGFTYIGVLVAVALLGSVFALTGEIWHTAAQREKERDLLFIGGQFRQAIRGYYEQSPSRVKTYPRTLEALLEDKRWPVARRHLRRIYRDPMIGTTEWALVTAADGGIIGVHSSSQTAPMKTGSFPAEYAHFQDAQDYRDWRFVYDSKAKRGLTLPAPVGGAALVLPALSPEPVPPPPSARSSIAPVATNAPAPDAARHGPDNPREVDLPDSVEESAAEAN